MLKFFRKHARGWFMTAVIAIIIVVFVLFFGAGVGGRQASTIATIDKRIITENEFHNEYERMLEMARLNFGDRLTPEMLKQMDLKAKAYNNILNREIIVAKASDFKIQVSDEELRNHIMVMPALQTDGVFDQNKYLRILRLNRMSAEDFEKLSRTDLIANKIESFVREGVKISDKEIYDLYTLQNQQMNVSFLRISGNDIRHKISPSQSDLEDYLKSNSSLFRVAEQLKIKYLFFGADAFAPEISDADIQNYYSTYRDNYQTKDGKQLALADVRNAILKELKRTRGLQGAYSEARKARNEIYQDDNMENYGRKHNLKINVSDFFPSNNVPQALSPINSINETLLDLQEGELSKVLPSPNGYYLLQVVAKKPSSVPALNAIENDVRRRFIESEAQVIAGKEADSVLERLRAGEDFEKVAAEKGLKIQETGYFQPSNTLPKIGHNENATEILMQLSAGMPYTEKPLFVDNAYVILKFKNATRPDEKQFEAQKGMYRQILTAMKQEEGFQTWLEGNKTALIKEKRVRIKKKLEDL